jgi:hypothetical protein
MFPYHRLSQWLIVFDYLHCVEMGSISDILVVYTDPILRVKVKRVSEYSCVYRFKVQQTMEEEWWLVPSLGQ